METVAVLVGEAALSGFFQVLFLKLSSLDYLKYVRKHNLEPEVNKWNQFLRKMNYVLADAEERQMSEGPIKLWLDDLRDLAYDIEDILDEFSYQVLHQKVMAKAEASTSKISLYYHGMEFNESLRSKMTQITQRFETITKEKENFNLTVRATGGSIGVVRERLETSSLVQESQVYGREKDKETLVNELLRSGSNRNPVSVVAIVGMGGLGKTTLAQLVYNDKTVSGRFRTKAWVCISDEFDVFKITVKIIEGFTKIPCNMKDLNTVQEALRGTLRGKKFLLILDDVWNENYLQWDALTKPLAAGRLGSKVLITTRNEKVAVASTADAVFMHHLKKLELEVCLSLLALHAFGVNTFSGHASLKEIGEQIAKKCDGLPLAAKALGGLLRGKSNPREWQTVLNSNMWELPGDKCPVLPALRVSYQHLPSHLKRCFAFCAIFPKDHEFDKDDLILWWMTEGLLEQSKLVFSNFTEVGNEYFKDLLSRSFFQPLTEGYKFVMHNFMNDLAMWVGGRTSLHLNTDEGSNYDMKFENPRHLSSKRWGYDVAEKFEKFSKPEVLRTFFLFGSTYASRVNLATLIKKMRCLKLLCLRPYMTKELPQSISELKHLRHLDMSLSTIQFLPDSICGLLNLQVLKLNGCQSLIKLPQEIGKLINLRVLDISDTVKLNTMPLRIECLKNLQILSKFIVGEKLELRLKELKELYLIRGELSIWGLEKVVDAHEARDANLKEKEGLDSLEFKWMEETSGVEKEETSSLEMEKQVQILNELQPHTTLRSLKIDGYNGQRFSEWVGNCCFTNLETLSLCDCKSASSLPPLGGMSSLKVLEIVGMHGVKKVGEEFLGNTSNSNQTFPSLETLILDRMPGLEEWSSCFGIGEETKVVFPRLQKMKIKDCPVLNGRLPNQLPLLEELSISKCPNLKNLECIHPSMWKLVVEDCSEATLKSLGDLTSLRSLKLVNITDLICMDDELLSRLRALLELEIVSCRVLKSLVRNDKEIEGMELKSLVRNDKKIEGMVGLQRLKIVGCDEMMSFGRMRLPSSLKEMEINRCNALKCLPEGFMMDGSSTCGPALEKLNISQCLSLTTFSMERFPDLLVGLSIEGCDKLESMPKFSDSIRNLTIVGCDHLQSLPRFPAYVVSVKIDNCLDVESTAIESKLEEMFAGCCSSLENLVIRSINLRRLPKNITSFKRIKVIEIDCCENLSCLPMGMQDLTCLRELTINECPNLEWWRGIDLPRELESLKIKGCEKVIKELFVEDQGLSLLVSLRHLNIDGGSCVLNIKQEAPVFLPKLQYLTMANFGNLENLAAAFQLPSSIEELSIENCAKLQELPILKSSSSLGSLNISCCPLLRKRCLDKKGEYWPLLSNIPKVQIDFEEIYPIEGSS